MCTKRPEAACSGLFLTGRAVLRGGTSGGFRVPGPGAKRNCCPDEGRKRQRLRPAASRRERKIAPVMF